MTKVSFQSLKQFDVCVQSLNNQDEQLQIHTSTGLVNLPVTLIQNCSKFFRDLLQESANSISFSSEWKPATCIILPDVEAETVKTIIKLLTTGQIQLPSATVNKMKSDVDMLAGLLQFDSWRNVVVEDNRPKIRIKNIDEINVCSDSVLPLNFNNNILETNMQIDDEVVLTEVHNSVHKCPYCEENFSEKDFKMHETQREALSYCFNDDISKLKCQISSCSSKFKHPVNLFMHQQQKHSLIRAPFSCQNCEMKFTKISFLINHEKSHGNNINAVYKINDGKIQFSYKVSKILKPGNGIVISSPFVNYKNSIQEIQDQFGVINAVSDTTCLICRKLSSSPKLLFQHQETIHFGVKEPYNCLNCDLKFGNDEELISHELLDHLNKVQVKTYRILNKRMVFSYITTKLKSSDIGRKSKNVDTSKNKFILPKPWFSRSTNTEVTRSNDEIQQQPATESNLFSQVGLLQDESRSLEASPEISTLNPILESTTSPDAMITSNSSTDSDPDQAPISSYPIFTAKLPQSVVDQGRYVTKNGRKVLVLPERALAPERLQELRGQHDFLSSAPWRSAQSGTIGIDDHDLRNHDVQDGTN